MNRTQFFTDAIAAELRRVFELRGIALAVVGQVSELAPVGQLLAVRCLAAEEHIPGNHTMKLDCQLALEGTSAAMAEGDVTRAEARTQQIAEVCHDVLAGRWRYRSLPHPVPGSDPEYDARPFIVLELFPSSAVPEAKETCYESIMNFRAYVQF